MSVDYVTQLHSAAGLISCSQCHEDEPCLAVAGQGLQLFDAASTDLTPSVQQALQGKSTAGVGYSCLAWQPTRPLLAVGSLQGHVCLYNAKLQHYAEDSTCHQSKVTQLLWSKTEASLLASGDEQGRVGLWTPDIHSKPSLLVSFLATPAGPVSAMAFQEATGLKKSQVSSMTVSYSISAGTCTDIYSADTSGQHNKLFAVPTLSPLLGLFWYQSAGQLVSVTASGELFVHGSSPADSQQWECMMKLKIGAGNRAVGESKLMVAWITEHILASASGQDDIIHLYDLETENNYILRTGQAGIAVNAVSALQYFAAPSMLVAGTTTGVVVMWTHCGQHEDSQQQAPAMSKLEQDPTLSWLQHRSMAVSGQVQEAACSLDNSVLAVRSHSGIYMCHRGLLQRQSKAGLAAIQTAAQQLVVQPLEAARPVQIETQLPIKGLDVSETHMLVTSSTAAAVYDISASPRLVFSFLGSTSPSPVLHGGLLFRVQGQALEVCNMAGNVSQTLQVGEESGKAAHLQACKGILLLYTSLNRLCMWRLKGGEAIPFAGAGKLVNLPEELTVVSMRCNCDGSKVSLLTMPRGYGRQQSRELFVYDIQTGVTSTCSFGTDSKTELVPHDHLWDSQHPLLLTCQAVEASAGRRQPPDSTQSGVTLVTMFATPQGVVLQDTQLISDCQGVVAVAAPWLHTFADFKSGQQAGMISKQLMQSFQGMQDVDDQTSRSLLDFSYHLAIGDMQEARKAVKLVTSAGLWRSLCLSALRSRRHQVVQLCLENMQDPLCARAIRQFGVVREPDAQLGLVAVQLGQLEDAKQLFVAANRPDLLNKLHQAQGDWDQALHVAEQSDKISCKATHFLYAQHQEANGELATAIKHHQLADTHRVEVPRMLFQADQVDHLGAYVKQMKDAELSRWWGRYCESIGDTTAALEIYQQANDTLALVRLHCRNEDFVAASLLVEETNDAAAAFLLARQLEATEQVAEAVHYFGKAGKSHQGVRLAKQHGMNADLLTLALQSPKPLMLDTAEYFEQRGELDKAVLLFQKAGREKRAVELCFSAQLYDTLASIASNLTANSDPALMARCADYFLERGDTAKGVDLLLAAKQSVKALTICEERNVTITESMAESLTPGQQVGGPDREALLRRIAKLAKQQGSFHLACKKYTQAGDKVKALKCLIRSGDTNKITFFAGVCRQADIYTLAANYLQTLDWHSRPPLAHTIVTFYSKAKAWDSLALFFEACAQIEVDDYRDYAKAVQALQESLKYVSNSQKAGKAEQVASLNARLAATSAFLEAQHLLRTDAAAAVQICNGLVVQLSDQSRDALEQGAGVRIGDVYAMLIGYWVANGGLHQAHQLLERMRMTDIALEPYVEAKTIEAVYKAVAEPQMQ